MLIKKQIYRSGKTSRTKRKKDVVYPTSYAIIPQSHQRNAPYGTNEEKILYRGAAEFTGSYEKGYVQAEQKRMTKNKRGVFFSPPVFFFAQHGVVSACDVINQQIIKERHFCLLMVKKIYIGIYN